MTRKISRAAVLGAGSMGAGISALLANAGIEVLLLDRRSPDNDDPNQIARSGINRQVQHRSFIRPEFTERISIGNIEDDASQLADADWIIEAVFEDVDVKRQIFKVIEKHRNPDSLVSSNTSTIPLIDLVTGMSQAFRRDFAIIHFFNPPRTMRLVELVGGPDTSPNTVAQLTRTVERQLGKVVLPCRDTPGFIANRIGNLWMAAGAREALDNDIPLELADALFSRPFGIPRTGIFGLFDYIGLQLVPGIWGGLTKALPPKDAYHRHQIVNDPLFQGLLERGWTGRTSESGFYRGRDEVITPDFDYRPRQLPEDAALNEKTAQAVITTVSPGGRFAKNTFLATLQYCCDTAPDIADSIEAIDLAMQLGYGWKKGPFALADEIGLELLDSMYHDTPPLLSAALRTGGFYPAPGQTLSTTGGQIPARKREDVVTAAELKVAGRTILANPGGTVTLFDDGIALLALDTPMNSCTAEVIELITETAHDGTTLGIRGLVIGNDEERAFSAGADLSTLASAAATGDPATAKEIFHAGREAFEGLAAADFPVVAAVRGIALGGGAELLLHCDYAVFHAESRIGFPERHVGLFPAWGGTARTLLRFQQSKVSSPINSAFQLIMSADPLPSAYDARAMGLLREVDKIIMSPDHVLSEALSLAREVSRGYTHPETALIDLPPTDPAGLTPWSQSSHATDNDLVIAEALARLLTSPNGEPVQFTAEELGDRETAIAAELIVLPANAERAEHMARTRKPLRN